MKLWSEILDVVGGCGLVESRGLFFSFGQGTLVVDLLVESCDGLSCGKRGNVGGGREREKKFFLGSSRSVLYDQSQGQGEGQGQGVNRL